MSDDKKSLDDLIGSVGQRKRKTGRGPKTVEQKKTLNPLDMLDLPDHQRKVVNCLAHKKQADLATLKRDLDTLSPPEIEQTLHALKDTGYIREALIDGEIYYRVVFGGRTSRSKICLPTDIWSRLNMDKVTFLQQMPMFQSLTRHELQAIAGQMEEQHYQRNEVIVWQGEPSDDAFLIKNGIVSISHLSPDRKSSQTLAYLRQGDILGEIGVLQNQVRSATATALSNIEVLVIKRDQFLELLKKYDMAAIELARMLGRQLVATSARLGQDEAENHLVLVFRVMAGTGGTTIAGAVASTLARETGRPTVYTEYPDPRPLLSHFDFTAGLFRHPNGYDIHLPQLDPSLPDDVDATLMVDHFVNEYANIVIGLPDILDEGTTFMLERADQVVLIAPPGDQGWEKLNELKTRIQPFIRSEQTGMLTVANRAHPTYQDTPLPGQVDFDLPFVAELSGSQVDLPAPLEALTQAIVNRLGRTGEIALYIPTTIDVGQPMDTTPYVNDALAFMGEHFGGATSNRAQGVWDSDRDGLVNEAVYIVRSFVTADEMNRHLNRVLDYVANLKTKLQQEAMAVEVDRKLMLV